jgi:hypothetical protein
VAFGAKAGGAIIDGNVFLPYFTFLGGNNYE